jgi:DNA-binding transcriptional LysR family regulator
LSIQGNCRSARSQANIKTAFHDAEKLLTLRLAIRHRRKDEECMANRDDFISSAPWAGVDVRRLRYFLAVAEELHFGRAADRLNIAQPALSRQIANLEGAIGALLFDRTRSNIHLTTAGETLLPRARDILSRVADAARFARRAAEGTIGILEVGFVGSATFSILPNILNQFRTTHKEVELVLHAMNTAELRAALVGRSIDVAFARPDISDPEIVNEVVHTEPLIVAMSENDPLADKSHIALGDLSASPFVLYPRHPRPSFADAILQICRQAGFSPDIAQETMEIQTALSLVSVGAGVSLVPESAEESQLHGVAYRPLLGDAPTTSLSLAYRRDNRSAVVAQFCAAVRAAVRRR